MTLAAAVLDEWDFYPCQVNDAVASISLNLWFERAALLASADTLYWVRFHMRDRGPHGMGTSTEADILNPIADQVVARAQKLDCYYVGRLRGDGRWSLFLYGPADQLDPLRALVNDTNCQVEVGSEQDPAWDYYRGFLLPSDERRQWMKDRRTVEVLQLHGDPLLESRRIDHWHTFRPPKGDRRSSAKREVKASRSMSRSKLRVARVHTVLVSIATIASTSRPFMRS